MTLKALRVAGEKPTQTGQHPLPAYERVNLVSACPFRHVPASDHRGIGILRIAAASKLPAIKQDPARQKHGARCDPEASKAAFVGIQRQLIAPMLHEIPQASVLDLARLEPQLTRMSF
jgi:hypothetical protein